MGWKRRSGSGILPLSGKAAGRRFHFHFAVWKPCYDLRFANTAHFAWQWQPTMWSLTMPTACMKA